MSVPVYYQHGKFVGEHESPAWWAHVALRKFIDRDDKEEAMDAIGDFRCAADEAPEVATAIVKQFPWHLVRDGEPLREAFNNELLDVQGKLPAAANDSTATHTLRRPRALEALNPGPALWEGVLPERAIFAIGALPGRSKSYTAAGLAYALATDAGQYLGRALPAGTAAVYVDVERLSMTELRLAVWCHADGRDATKLPLLLTDGVRLSDPNTVKAFIEATHAAQAQMLGDRRISVVLLDSLGALVPGQEMNSSAPATSVGMQLRRIRDSLGCAVGVIAHSPKSGDETVAGSLHFDAIFDTALFVRSEDGAAGSLYVKKDNGLALEEHERFTHWHRATLSALVGERMVRVHRLEHSDAPAARGNVRRPWKENSTTGRVFKKHIQLSPDNRPLSGHEWKDGCLEFLNPRQIRGGFFDAKDMLRKHRAIEETAPGSDLWVRKMYSGDPEGTAGGLT